VEEEEEEVPATTPEPRVVVVETAAALEDGVLRRAIHEAKLKRAPKSLKCRVNTFKRWVNTVKDTAKDVRQHEADMKRSRRIVESQKKILCKKAQEWVEREVWHVMKESGYAHSARSKRQLNAKLLHERKLLKRARKRVVEHFESGN